MVPLLNAYSTAKDVAFLTENRIEKKEIHTPNLTIYFTGLDLDTKQRVFASIKDLEAQYKFDLKVRSDLENVISPVIQ